MLIHYIFSIQILVLSYQNNDHLEINKYVM